MRFREESTLGWMMLAGLGGQLTGIRRHAELFAAAAAPLERGSRSPGKNIAMGRREGMSDSLLSAAQRRFILDETGDLPESVLTEVGDAMARAAREMGATPEDIERAIAKVEQARAAVLPPEPEPETFSYRTDDGLWWLSYANDDTGCAGVTIVHLVGEQSAARAAAVARELGLAPAGDWETVGIQVPEEGRAEHEPFVGRFLTTTEAEAAFAAQSIGSYEAEHPGVDLEPLVRSLTIAEPLPVRPDEPM